MTRPRAVRLEPGCGACWSCDVPIDGIAVGLDRDLVALRAATRPAGGALVGGDAMSLPIVDGAVDEIVLRAVLHHLHPVEIALAELARVAVPGCRLAVIDGVALPAARALRLAEELVAAGRSPEPIAGFDVDALASTVGASGFVVDSIRLDGAATFATRPIVSEDYVTDRFVLEARRVSSTSK